MRDSVDGYITKTKQGQIHYDMVILLHSLNSSETLFRVSNFLDTKTDLRQKVCSTPKCRNKTLTWTWKKLLIMSIMIYYYVHLTFME